MVNDKGRKDIIKQMIVTSDGKYFACSDNRNCVSLFKRDHINGVPDADIAWHFTGKIMSH